MKGEYLQDYLTILPSSDRKEVEELIRKNEDIFEIQVVNREQFEELIQVLAKGIAKISKLVKQGEKLDAEIFNSFFSGIGLDLENLYRQHLTAETVVANYDRILQGILEDMKRELAALRQRVYELDMRAKGEDGLLVRGYGFEEDNRGTYMETDIQQYGHLFTDRDGSMVPQSELEKDYHQHYLSLPKIKEVDCLRNSSGRITASISVDEHQGMAIESKEYDISKAIDDSLDTYWAEVIVADAPIEGRMNKMKKE